MIRINFSLVSSSSVSCNLTAFKNREDKSLDMIINDGKCAPFLELANSPSSTAYTIFFCPLELQSHFSSLRLSCVQHLLVEFSPFTLARWTLAHLQSSFV